MSKYYLILRDESGSGYLSVWVGSYEKTAKRMGGIRGISWVFTFDPLRPYRGASPKYDKLKSECGFKVFIVGFGGGAEGGGGRKADNKMPSPFRRGTSQHADYHAIQGEISSTLKTKFTTLINLNSKSPRCI